MATRGTLSRRGYSVSFSPRGGRPSLGFPGPQFQARRVRSSIRRIPMSVISLVKKWFRDSGRRKQASARKPIRSRLTLEALEDRQLMSANFLQTNLVSDLPGLARLLDPTLKNAWGISLSPNGGAFWVSSNGTGVSELYLRGVHGNPLNAPLKGIIPGGSPTRPGVNINPPIMAHRNPTPLSVA